MRALFITIFLMAFISSPTYADNKSTQITTTTQQIGSTTYVSHQSQNDFLAAIGQPVDTKFTNSQELFSTLNQLVADVKNNDNMAQAFNILLLDQNVSAQDKLAWLKENLSKLPTPFFLLNATLIAPYDKKKAEQLYYLSNIMLIYDFDRCTDDSVQDGIVILKQMLLPLLYKNLANIDVTGQSQANIDAAQKLILKIEHDNASQINNLFKMYPQQSQAPYWLAYHGMAVFTSDNMDDKNFFKPESEWPKIKAADIQEQIANAKKRHNY